MCFVIVLYLNLQCFLLGLNEANHDCTSSSPNKDDVDPYGTPLLSLGGAGDINDNEDNGDDGDIAGPTVEVLEPPQTSSEMNLTETWQSVMVDKS